LGWEPSAAGGAVLSTTNEPAWRWLGWFGLVLALLGLGDIALAWVPLGFGNWQWEFGTVAGTLAGLPLTSIGLAAVLASALAQGQRRRLTALGIALLVLGLLILGSLALFCLDIPLALRAAQGPASIGIKKAIAKTVMLGVGFSILYLSSGWAALRQSRRR